MKDGVRKIGIIGAGPAGMMAAIFAARNGASVTIFEKNKYVGRKLGITGKGRCNVTNDCDKEEFLKNVISNSKFLYSAINNFDSQDTKSFFTSCGIELKTERGRRVFPVSDKAKDIVKALEASLAESGCRVIYEKVVDLIVENNSVAGLKTANNKYDFDGVIISTGGMSYPLTGSDGDGYRFVRKLGIRVTELKPSLVPLETSENVKELMGLSLKNVSLSVLNKKTNKKVFEEQGEMLFTHFGLSGPLVLSASSHMSDMEKDKYQVLLDLKPALDNQTLDKRILRDFDGEKNKDFSNSLSKLLPTKIVPYVIKLTKIPPSTKVNEITKEQRKVLVETLKCLKFNIRSFRPIDEAIVTSGGIDVSEINSSKMESKKISGLYFAGEVIDVDAYTGGYNLQIAFSTGALAGIHAAWGD